MESVDRRKPYCIAAAGRHYLDEQMTSLGKVVKIALGRLKHA